MYFLQNSESNNNLLFIFVILIIISQRLAELAIAKRNEKWLLSKGAVESGKGHYRYIVMLHTFFIISLITEYLFKSRHNDLNIINYLFLVFLIILEAGRIWVLKSLGRYWNTKILRIPDTALVDKGPYKYLKHPNYVIVVCEILIIPLIFNLYYTAVVFTILNAVMLTVRIRIENKVL
jgi:methyltransferase